MNWTKSAKALPEFNRKVLAYCRGYQSHVGAKWKREGYVFMVRHKSSLLGKHQWSEKHYDAALKELGADSLEVTDWMYLEEPKELEEWDE
jgi:hypothetical protein